MKNDILRQTNDNPGGINSFRAIPAANVESIPETYNGAIHTEIVLKSNSRWFEFYCTEFTMEFRDEQIDSDQGASFKKTLSGKAPKNNEDLISVFDGMKNGKYILDITYNNGLRLLAGTVDEPLYFKSVHSSKSDIAGRNEHDILFEGEGISKSPIYNV